jgi:hypothetical protein
MRRRLPPSLSHLDGLNWEALILSCPDPGCQSYTGGKIVLTTTFIEHITSDVEIATCIAHEVFDHFSLSNCFVSFAVTL